MNRCFPVCFPGLDQCWGNPSRGCFFKAVGAALGEQFRDLLDEVAVDLDGQFNPGAQVLLLSLFEFRRTA